MIRRRVGRVLVGFLVVVMGVVAGYVVIWTGVTLPSYSDIDDAAFSLTPPGATVDEVIAGRPSSIIGVEPYRVFIDATSQPASYLERLAEAEATAEAAGWVESARFVHHHVVRFEYDRGALDATVRVWDDTVWLKNFASPNLSIRVATDEVTVTLHRRVGAVIGGVLALGAWVVWRRRRPDPVVEAPWV